jgi:hypothetical protein
MPRAHDVVHLPEAAAEFVSLLSVSAVEAATEDNNKTITGAHIVKVGARLLNLLLD